MIKQPISFAIVLFATLFSGCTTLGPDYKEPKAAIEKKWIDYKDPSVKSSPALTKKWWHKAFNDRTLNTLVDTALKENLTLRSAGLRVLQARQTLAITVGNQYPQTQALQGEAQSGAPFSSSPSQNYDLGFNLSWEADVWGRFERQIQSASAELNASVADYDGVMISLISEVAQTYLLIRTTQTRINIAKDNLKLQKQSLRITEAKFNAGEVSALDKDQAQTLYFNTQAYIATLKPTLQQLKNSLAILLGQPPHDMSTMLGTNKGIPNVNGSIALGMPQNLLRRRPDIRSSERQLAAQSAQIGYAVAELYPYFTIGGSIGTSAGSAGSDLFRKDMSNWSTFASFQWNIFNYGRLKSNVRLQDAIFQQELEDYRQTVLEAQGEVENAIVSFLASKQQLNSYLKALNASKRAVKLSTLRYEDGLVNFNTVISTLQTLASQQDTLAQTQGNTATDLINVYKALGGGWEIRGDRAPDELLPKSVFNEMRGRTDYWKNNLPDRKE